MGGVGNPSLGIDGVAQGVRRWEGIVGFKCFPNGKGGKRSVRGGDECWKLDPF